MKYELRSSEWDKDRTTLWRVNDDGTEEDLGTDYGEPEDNSFGRDWGWVSVELNRLARLLTQAAAKETT